MLTRRRFMAGSAAAGFGVFLVSRTGMVRYVQAANQDAVLGNGDIPQFVTPLLVPPVMPRAGTKKMKGGKNADYYEISMRQISQQILPARMPPTTVWGYGAVTSESKRGLLVHNAPSLTIESRWNQPVQVKWINELVDAHGDYLPHLLPVDPTLHWANPPGGLTARDTRPTFEATPARYTGPVPIVTHVHGAVGVGDESDGYAEAWFLPDAKNIPLNYAENGTWYDFFKTKAFVNNGTGWGRGYATFTYPNLNRASTIWYHDHAIGMTRLNVYAGPAGFYIVRGGPDDTVLDVRTGAAAILPGPAPKEGDAFPSNKTYFEIPIAIQDRTFNTDGSLFYPDTRTFFDGIAGPYLPELGDDGMGFSPIWNPEFFGNTMMVNGNTWPFQVVQQRRYRFRFLNGCDSRFLILDFAAIPGVEVWQIGNEGGFLPAPVNLTATNGNRLLLGLAERADLIVDFAKVPVGNHELRNVGPDEPFGGGVPGVDFPMADPATTGRIMQFRVGPALAADPTTPPRFLKLPIIAVTPPATLTRSLALIEEMGMGVDVNGNPFDENGDPLEGPRAAKLGTIVSGMPLGSMWEDAVTENPALGATETWEFHNTTGDAHPMHIHETVFEVIDREGLVATTNSDSGLTTYLPDGNITLPEPWEAGFKDTVTAYPGQVTRVKATFTKAGQYVWHCHIVSHEDNEMMRPFRIGPVQPGQPRP